MNFFGGLKSKISGMYKTSNDSDNSNDRDNSIGSKLNNDDMQHTMNILYDENKFLKSKIRIIENSIFGTNSTSSEGTSQFGKLFKELKSTLIFTSGKIQEESNTTISEYKNFLSDNLLLYNSIEEDDLNIINNMNINENDWENNKELFIFKQKILERNYNEMLKNLIVAKELNELITNKSDIKKEIYSEVTQNKSEMVIKSEKKSQDKDEMKSGLKSEDKPEIVSNPIDQLTSSKVKEENIKKSKATDLESSLLGDLLTLDKSDEHNKINSFKNSNNSSSKDKLNELLKIDEEDFDLSAVLNKEKNATTSVLLSNNENKIKSMSTNPSVSINKSSGVKSGQIEENDATKSLLTSIII